MRPLLLLSALSALACSGAPDDPSTDTDAVPSDTDRTDPATDSDAPTDTDVSDGTDEPSASELTFAPVVCADPPRADGPFETRRAARMVGSGDHGVTGGAATTADLTGDGRLDIVVLGDDEWQYFVGASDGSFTERAADLAPGVTVSEGTSATPADVDGDGDLDLFITRHRATNLLLVNDGTGRLVDGTAAAGLAGVNRRHLTSSFADMDGDGDLDLFVAAFGGRTPTRDPTLAECDPADPNYLYENQGNGTFLDVSSRLPPEAHDGYTRLGAWVDLVGDALPELIVVNDFGQARPTRVLTASNGVYSLVSGTGLDAPLDGGGLAVGDVDADGRVDFAMSSTRNLGLYLQSGAAWLDWGASRGLRPSATQVDGWGVALADMDNDADLDLTVGYGHWSAWDDSPEDQPDSLYLQAADGSFEDVAAEWGVDDVGPTRAIVSADLDDDGWPDLLVRELEEPTRLLLSRCDAAAWLKVHLRDPGANRFAIGARVTARTGDLVQSRWIRAGGTSMFAAEPPEALFGLADATTVDELTVTWPDGTQEVFRDLDVRGELTITRARP